MTSPDQTLEEIIEDRLLRGEPAQRIAADLQLQAAYQSEADGKQWLGLGTGWIGFAVVLPARHEWKEDRVACSCKIGLVLRTALDDPQGDPEHWVDEVEFDHVREAG